MMRLLASYAMRGRSQAVMLALLFAVLSLVMLPLIFFSSAILALATLRKGVVEGFIILVVLSCIPLLLLSFGKPYYVLSYSFFILWVSILVFAYVLRTSRSLALTILSTLALGLLLLIGHYLYIDDPVSYWREILEIFTKPLEDNQVMDPSDRASQITTFAKWMPGLVVSSFLLQSMVSIFIARWWQAMLYNPGGFRIEFHQLRLPRTLAIFTLLVTIPVLFLSIFGNIDDLNFLGNVAALLLMTAWFLHGLALAHSVVTMLGANVAWLVGMYTLIVLATPQMMVVLAAAGLADVWFDFRARFDSENRTS